MSANPLRHNVNRDATCATCETLREDPKARLDVIIIEHDAYVLGYEDGYEDAAGYVDDDEPDPLRQIENVVSSL